MITIYFSIRCRCFKEKEEEKTELTDITYAAGIKKKSSSRSDGSEYAPPNTAAEMPHELRADPYDGWWGRPQTRLSML